jgi:putative membrane protein
MMYWYGTGMGGWGYVLMTVNLVLFWGLIVGGIFAVVRHFGGPGRAHQAVTWEQQTPEQILAQRFARGEIDEEEYHRRIAIVRGSPTR